MITKRRHYLEYGTLAVIISVILFLVFLFQGQKDSLPYIGAAGSVLYVLWGIIHHTLEGRLTRYIFFEYVLFGILVFLLFFAAASF